MNLFHLHHFHLYLKQIKINYTDDTGISPMMEAINKGYNYIMNMLIIFLNKINFFIFLYLNNFWFINIFI